MAMDPTSASDEQLVAAVGRFDETAIGELYRRHARAVFGLAQRVVGHRELAEEVLQDVFVRLWNRPERFDPTRGPLRSFLLREAHGRAVDRIRSDEARRRREDRYEQAGERVQRPEDIEREVWDMIRSEKVADALAALSRGEREAIVLAYFGGHTYREVAALLDEPEGTIKSRIRIGLHKLADVLEASGMGAQP
jgi:RNA polymerase sigma-70 factor, ECF subfamily